MKNIVLFLALSLFVMGCHKSNVKNKYWLNGKLVAKDDVKEHMEQAQALYDMGEVEAAVSRLKTWVDNTAYNESQDRAYELIVTWLLQLKKYNEAKRVASYFISNHKDSKSVDVIIELFNEAHKAPEASHSESSEKLNEEGFFEDVEPVDVSNQEKNVPKDKKMDEHLNTSHWEEIDMSGSEAVQ